MASTPSPAPAPADQTGVHSGVIPTDRIQSIFLRYACYQETITCSLHMTMLEFMRDIIEPDVESLNEETHMWVIRTMYRRMVDALLHSPSLMAVPAGDLGTTRKASPPRSPGL
jgi:hypothetical protein